MDHVEFETGKMVDDFLQSWRSSGHQRFGYLYGRYVQHPEVPLGIKAQVAYIYEVRSVGRVHGWSASVTPSHCVCCVCVCSVHAPAAPARQLGGRL